MGRSGTQFLASLLSKSPGALVYHEPAAEDRIYFGLRYAGNFNKVVDDYLERRFRELLPADGIYEVYGEVNSYLRYEMDWLREKFNPILIHLVRDGRDFVRSAYTREVYTPDEKKLLTVPRDNDPMAETWGQMNRFQKLCWYWKHTNEFLASKMDRTVLFEKLLKDYDYFTANVLEPIGLNIPFDTWKKETRKPKNISKKNIFKKKVKRMIVSRGKTGIIQPIPHWSQWNPGQIQQFNEICSETMRKFGYI